MAGCPIETYTKCSACLHTGPMRLPQSFSHASIRVVFLLTFAAMVMMLPLPARAAEQLTCTPSVVRFGGVLVGQSETQVVVLSNTGSSSVTVSAMRLSGKEFSISGLTLPLVIPAGSSVAVNVTFSPTTTGWVGTSAIFNSNASNSVLRLELEAAGATSDALAANPSSVSFGPVAVGASAQRSITLTNLRSWNVKLSAFQLTGAGFSVSGPALPMILTGGQQITLNLTFAPQSAGMTGGDFFVSGLGLSIPLSGTGTTTTAPGQLSIAPTPVNFGNVNVGAVGTQTISLSASGGSVTVSSDTSNSSQFVLSGISLPLTIPAGQSSSFSVAFKPSSTGALSGSLSITSNASNGPNVNLPLSGTGVATTAGVLSVAPAPLNFGNVTVGTTGSQPITLSASGASVTVSSDASNNSQYVLNGATFPFTIPAGQSVQYSVSFTPKTSGTVSGSLTFVSNASSSQTVESLSGTGIAQQHSVDLSWNSTAGVAGYNVYRSTSPSGAFIKINPTLDGNTAYTDSSVVSGQTYYYAATSVDSSGMESARSTPPVQASIP